MNRWTQRVASIAGFLGIVSILAAIGFFIIELQLTGTSGFLFIWGLALVLVWVILNPEPFMDMVRGKGLRYGTLSILMTAFLLGLLVVVNVWASQHPDAQIDMTKFHVHTLDARTKQLLNQVTDKMQIVVFETGQTAQAGTNGQLPVADLLSEFRGQNSRITYSIVDPSQYRTLAQAYGVQQVPSVYCNYKSRRDNVTATSEADLDACVLKVLQGGAREACFVTGHGEPPIASAGGQSQAPGQNTFTELGAYLQQQNFILKGILLGSAVSTDCQLVIEMGPQQQLAAAEVQVLDTYLKGGGHLLVMADAFKTQNLNDLLGNYGVTLDGGVLYESNSAARISADPTVVPALVQQGHKITQALPNFVFYAINSTGVTTNPSGAKGYTLSTLAQTDDSTYEAAQQRTDYSTSQAGDRKGPIPVAVAVESSGAVTGAQHARLVVIGSADFVSDSVVSQLQANADLLVESLNWVGEREVSVPIPATSQQQDTLSMSTGDQRKLFFLLSLVLPGLILLTGLSVWLSRR